MKLNALILTTHVFLKITWRKMARLKKLICEKTIITMVTKHQQNTPFLLHQNNQLPQNNAPLCFKTSNIKQKPFPTKHPTPSNHPLFL
jgi:hypothetical protein